MCRSFRAGEGLNKDDGNGCHSATGHGTFVGGSFSGSGGGCGAVPCAGGQGERWTGTGQLPSHLISNSSTAGHYPSKGAGCSRMATMPSALRGAL